MKKRKNKKKNVKDDKNPHQDGKKKIKVVVRSLNGGDPEEEALEKDDSPEVSDSVEAEDAEISGECDDTGSEEQAGDFESAGDDGDGEGFNFISPDEMIARNVINRFSSDDSKDDKLEDLPEESIASGKLQKDDSSGYDDDSDEEDGEDSMFLSPDEMIAKNAVSRNISDIGKEDRTGEITEVSAELQKDESVGEDEDSSGEEGDDSLFLSPDEMIGNVYGGKLHKESQVRKDAGDGAKSLEDRILDRILNNLEGPEEEEVSAPEHLRASNELADEMSAAEIADLSSDNDDNGNPVVFRDVEKTPEEAGYVKSPGGKLTPDDLDGSSLVEESFNQLDVGPIFTGAGGYSPVEVLAPDEMQTENVFVSKALEKGTVVLERYNIVKILSEKRDRNTYKVTDNKVENKKLILKEFITSDMDREEYKRRRDAFRDTVRIINTFKHENLVMVYEAFTENYKDYYLMEVVDGLPITKLADMNTKPFSEKEALKWGLQLCDAAEFMHYRPTPFTLGDIKPWHIMVDSEGKIRITGYDLQRFFDTNRTMEFMPDDPKKLYSDITKVARILFYILNKKEFDENAVEVEWAQEVSPKMKKLLEITCRSEQKTYGDIKVFREKLINTQVEDEADSIARRFNFPKLHLDFSWIGTACQKVASQSPLMIGLEVIFLVFLVFMLWAQKMEKVYSRPAGPLMYVSVSDNLILFNVTTGEIIKEIPFDKGVSLIYPARIKHKFKKDENPVDIDVLLVGNQKSRAFKVFATKNMEYIKSFSAELNPSKIVPDFSGDNYYCIHPDMDVVSVIGAKDLTLSRIMPAGDHPVDLIYLEESAPSNSSIEAESPAPGEEKPAEPDKPADSAPDGRRSTLAVSNSGSGDILFINARTGAIDNMTVIEGSPGSMVYHRKRGEIIFADTRLNRLGFMNVEKREVVKYVDLPGKGPSAMAVDFERNRLWIALEESDGLALMDLETDGFISFENKSEGDKTAQMLKTGVGRGPGGLYLDGGNARLWVMCQKSKRITVLDLTNNEVISSTDLGKAPTSFCFEAGK